MNEIGQIHNGAGLPSEWTVQKLKEKHPSRPFNPDIANSFFRSGMIKAWGRGIERIIEACREENAPEPKITYENDGLWVQFSFSREYLDLIDERTTQESGDTTPETPKTTLETTPEIQETTLERIFELLKTNPSTTRKELAKELGLTLEGVKYHIRKLKEDGRVKHHGPTKGGYWEVLK